MHTCSLEVHVIISHIMKVFELSILNRICESNFSLYSNFVNFFVLLVGGDYVPVASGSAIPVVFGTDESTTTITIPITNDELIEGVENFEVHLRQVTSFTDALSITAPTATVSIVDNDGELVEDAL